MLKMGRMCHCGVTLYRVNPDDGTIVWSVNRGSHDWHLLADGNEIYTAGENVTGQNDGRVIRRVDETTRAPAVWWSDRHIFTSPTTGGALAWTHSVGNARAMAFSDDGHLWVMGGNGTGCYERATGTQTGFSNRGQWAPNGFGNGMAASGNKLFSTSGRSVVKQSTAMALEAQYTVPASAQIAALRDVCLAGGAVIVSAQRGIYFGGSYLYKFDTDLNLLALVPSQSSPVPGVPDNAAQRDNNSAAGTRVVAYGSDALVQTWSITSGYGVPKLRKVNVTTMTEEWGIEIDGHSDGLRGNPVCVDGSDIFIVDGNEIARLDGSGADVWRTSMSPLSETAFYSRDIAVGSDFVVVVHLSSTSSATCLERDSGDVRWRILHGGGDMSVFVESDRVYVCGPVGALSLVT